MERRGISVSKKIIVLIFGVFLIIIPVKTYAYSAKSYCVIEKMSKRILMSENEFEQMGMASTTKIMTAYTALCNSNINDEVTVSKNASYTEGSSLYLKEGETIKMIDLIYGLMLNSGNDAAVAIAEHISGTTEKFAQLMNENAKKIGVNNTNFTNPSGLSDEKHYTTAYDLAIITAYALENDEFAKIVSTKTYVAHTINTNRTLYFANHNKLLSSYNGCCGVKTGYTKSTGRCLVSTVNKNGWQAICVTLNDSDDWNDHKQLFDKTFANYSLKKAVDKNTVLKTVKTKQGKTVMISSADDVYLVLSENDKLRINLEQSATEIKLPLKKYDCVGTAEFFINDQSVAVKKTVACNDADLDFKETFFIKFRDLIRIWMSFNII